MSTLFIIYSEDVCTFTLIDLALWDGWRGGRAAERTVERIRTS